MSQTDTFARLRDRWWLVACGLILGALVGAGVHLLSTPKYTATATTFVGVSNADNVSDLSTGSDYVLKQMQSYESLVTSPMVLDPVIQSERLSDTSDALADRISTGTTTTTTVMTISVTDSDAARAARIANAVSKRFGTVLSGITSGQTRGKVNVASTLIRPAQTPARPSNPSLKVLSVLGALGGLALGAVLALALPGRLLRRKNSRSDAAALAGPDASQVKPADERPRNDVKEHPAGEGATSLEQRAGKH